MNMFIQHVHSGLAMKSDAATSVCQATDLRTKFVYSQATILHIGLVRPKFINKGFYFL
jgi:hypothetical protein